jgi:hypothetical protein
MLTPSKPRRLSRFGLTTALLTIGIGVSTWAFPQAIAVAEVASLQAEVTALRPSGPEGLQTFLQRHARELKPGTVPAAPLRAALDQLCQMKDCYAARLYWYTDLEAAKAAAQISGKPILSLRLLGNLDQDLSCANSRFFRVALYPNAKIAKLLQDKFILHWQSERPVPKVTVDFGDGRTMERTITGNSIHYILNSDGRPLDALPGLYGPQAFATQLQQSLTLFQQWQQRPAIERTQFLRNYHQNRLAQLHRQWQLDLQRVGVTVPPVSLSPRPVALPNAFAAGQVAMTKAVVESPLLAGIQLAANQQRALTEITDKEAWQKLAQLYQASVRLDANSLALIQQKKSNNGTETPVTPAALATIAQNLEAAMALDTVRNEYTLRGQLHQWFMRGTTTANLQTLNTNVYSRLFLTPASDPWLGLLAPDSFSAIDQDGLRRANP